MRPSHDRRGPAATADHSGFDASKRAFDVTLDIVGDGISSELVRRQAASLGLDHVVFHGRQPRTMVGCMYRQCDFYLVTLRDLPVFRVTMPSKLQNGLAFGVPAIVTAVGETAQFVEAADAGMACPPESSSALADAIRRAHAMNSADHLRMRQAASRLFREALAPEVVHAQWLDLLEATARHGRQPARPMAAAPMSRQAT